MKKKKKKENKKLFMFYKPRFYIWNDAYRYDPEVISMLHRSTDLTYNKVIDNQLAFASKDYESVLQEFTYIKTQLLVSTPLTVLNFMALVFLYLLKGHFTYLSLINVIAFVLGFFNVFSLDNGLKVFTNRKEGLEDLMNRLTYYKKRNITIDSLLGKLDECVSK